MINHDLGDIRRPAMPRNASSRKWYTIRNADGSGTDSRATVLIYDYIGYPFVQAEQFVRDLASITASTIEVRINSPGGDVFEGIAIHNALKRHAATIEVYVDGIAASTASWVAMAGDSVCMAGANTYLMIHNPVSIAYGDAEEMRKRAELLDQFKDTIAQMYAERSGKPVNHFKELMTQETWLTADDAVSEGLADEVSSETPAGEASNAFDLGIFNRVPAPLKNAQQGKRPAATAAPNSKREVERILRDGGCSNAQAKAIASLGFKDSTEPRDEDVDALASLVASHVAANKQILTP